MRKKIATALLMIAVLSLASCGDKDDGIYVSTSGEGSVIINYDSPAYLYRMVLFTNEVQQDIYLMGNTAYVNADAEFKGQGAVVRITIPNDADNTTLQAQSFDIGTEDYTVSYSRYINYVSINDEADLIPVESGTVLIRKSGSFYDIRLLGQNNDLDNVLISYRGYIYRRLIELEDDSDGDTE